MALSLCREVGRPTPDQSSRSPFTNPDQFIELVGQFLDQSSSRSVDIRTACLLQVMPTRPTAPSVSRDYRADLLPEDVAVILEALGHYARVAAEEKRGDDVLRAFSAAKALSNPIEEAMWAEGERQE